jgi:probable rRNA maturation factor
MTIEFINDQEWGIEKSSFGPLIERLQGVVDTLEGILNVIFVTDAYIQSLNKSYREKNEPTDVLSFNYNGGKGDDNDLIGEIYISVDTAKKQAEEQKHDLQDELNKLFVHGFLHIHGHDHEKDEDYKKMLELEERVLHF